MRIVKLYAAVVMAVFAIWGGYRLMFVDAGVPTHWPPAMRFRTACLTSTNGPTSTAGLTQSFKVTADAVGGVTLLPAIAPGTSGELLFELRGGSGEPKPLSRGSVPMAGLATDEPVTLKTPPVPTPADGSLTLWIGRSNDSGCLAFQASAVSAPDAQLVVGDREVFGDLLFQVHADRGTALDEFQRWLAAATRINAPSVVLAAMALVYACGVSVLSWMLTAGGSQGRSQGRAQGRGPE